MTEAEEPTTMASEMEAAGAMPADQGATPDAAAKASSDPQPATGAKDELGEGGKAALDREREARREAEKRAKTLESQIAKFQEVQRATENANLSELEKATKRVAELEKQSTDLQTSLREQALQMAVIDAARPNSIDPDAVFRFIDRSEVEYAEDGRPKNVAKLVKEVLDRKEYLAKKQPDYGGGQRGTAPSTAPGMNAILRGIARGG